MSSKMKLKFNANLILLITALLFIGIFIEMQYGHASKSSLNWLGSRATKIHVWIHKERAEAALSELARGNEKPSIELLRDWIAIRKGDRAYPWKRSVLKDLSVFLHSAGRFQELRDWSQYWYRLDNRDITGHAFYYEALRHSVDHCVEGEDGLQSLFYKFPKNRTAAIFYASFATQEEQADIYSLYLQPQVKAWQIYWVDTKSKRFNKDNRAPLKLQHKGDNRWEFTHSFDGAIKQLRIDPPSRANVIVSELLMTVNGIECPISTEKAVLHDMTLKEGELISSGGDDPYFYFKTGACNTNDYSAASTVRFQFTLAPNLYFPN